MTALSWATFLWLWLHWSWFTVILSSETEYKMSNPTAAAREIFVAIMLCSAKSSLCIIPKLVSNGGSVSAAENIAHRESLSLSLIYIYIYGSLSFCLSFCLSFWLLLIRFHILLLTDNITTSLVPRQQTCKNTSHVPVGILAFRVVDVTLSLKVFLFLYIFT